MGKFFKIVRRNLTGGEKDRCLPILIEFIPYLSDLFSMFRKFLALLFPPQTKMLGNEFVPMENLNSFVVCFYCNILSDSPGRHRVDIGIETDAEVFMNQRRRCLTDIRQMVRQGLQSIFS